MPPLRTCLDCNTLTTGPRCPTCKAAQQRTKDARRPDRRSHAEQQRRRATIAQHVAVYGWVCPGDERHERHPCQDLTADHITPVGAGGREDGPLRVLCRSRNSARGARLA